MDQELIWIRKIQRNQNRKYANLLIDQYYDEIYVYAYRQIQSKETAMDITQEIFISMLQSIAGYDYKKSAFRTWLYRIATNKIIDFRRSREYKMIQMEAAELPDIPSEKDFLRNIIQRNLLKEIEAYISQTEGVYQEIFRLRIYGEYSFKEIAELTGTNEASVKSRFYRLSRKIRKEFFDEYTNA